jgi:N-acetylglucosaminyldiphosphoundecaprenol N-acetyl-beta-D-mannosaminyltransferase
MERGPGRRRWLLGLPVDALTLPEAATWVLDAAKGERPRLVVTLNPEIAIGAHDDPLLFQALRGADLSVADGVGIAWAARRQGERLPGRVPGVDLVVEVLRSAGPELSVFLLGGRPGVAERAAAAIARRYGTRVAGARHGYFRRPEEVPEVCREVAASGCQLLLAGLGAGQERFLWENATALGAAVSIGVGGTLDVLAGEVRRMPAWSSRLGVEWLLRVGLDPKRWRRVPRLLRFIWMVLRRNDTRP